MVETKNTDAERAIDRRAEKAAQDKAASQPTPKVGEPDSDAQEKADMKTLAQDRGLGEVSGQDETTRESELTKAAGVDTTNTGRGSTGGTRGTSGPRGTTGKGGAHDKTGDEADRLSRQADRSHAGVAGVEESAKQAEHLAEISRNKAADDRQAAKVAQEEKDRVWQAEPWVLYEGTEITVAGQIVTLLADVPVSIPGDEREQSFVGFLVALGPQAFGQNAKQLDGVYNPLSGAREPEERLNGVTGEPLLASELP